MNSHVDENEGSNKYAVHILKGDKNYEVNVDSSTGKVLEITQSVQGRMMTKVSCKKFLQKFL